MKKSSGNRCKEKTFFWVGTPESGFKVADLRCTLHPHGAAEAHSAKCGTAQVVWETGVFFVGEMEPYKAGPGPEVVAEEAHASSSGQKREYSQP